MWEDATLRLIGHRDRGGEGKAEEGMERERKGNRGARSAGGKSALLNFSSLQPLSFSLCPCLPHPVVSIYHQAPTLLSSLLSLSHFASCSLLPPSLHLSPCCPLCLPSPLPRHSLPPSFTDDLGSHSLSLPFMKLLMLFPAHHPHTHTPRCPIPTSLISLSGSILSLQIVTT